MYTLGAAVTGAQKKIPLVESAIEQDTASKAQLEADLKQHQTDRSEAKEAVAKATGLREKEATAFSKTEAELKTNVGALEKAITAVDKGMAGGFLQTTAASVLRTISIDMDMTSVDRDMLASFLSQSSSYSPKGGEISGILKTMKDEMAKDLEDATNTEYAAIADYEGLMTAKNKEIESLTHAIEVKTVRVGELGVKLAQAKNDLEDTKEGLAEDQQFLADLDGNCEQKKKDWNIYKKMQGEELLALADTIKILNDDDALELFKKTVPAAGSSLLQVRSSDAKITKKVLSILKESRAPNGRDPRVDLLEVALRGGAKGFEKIIKMIDELVAVLKTEQIEDDKKKTWCEAEFDKAEDKKKALLQGESDLEVALEDGAESIATVKSDLEALADGIVKLDKDVAEATEQRKEEHDDFVTTLASNNAAKDLLGFAKNRMNKFYNPKLYEAPPKRDSESFLQIRSHNMKDEPAPPPEADVTYKKSGEESGGVIAMMDLMIKDLDKDITESEVEEKDAQKDYEQFMDDAQNKRAQDSKAITDKTAAQAESESQLETDKDSLKSTRIQLMENDKMIGSLHAECDWLIRFYDLRSEARTGEIDALSKAKDVLRGADYSF